MTANPIAVAPPEVPARRALDLFVLDRVKIQAWDRVLFVQCGDGWIVEEASRRAMRSYVCGLDTSGVEVALAKQLREVPGKVEFATWDGQALPVPDQAFDRVVAILDLPRPTDAWLMRELRRVLREAGDLYLVHPTAGETDIRQALAGAGWTQVRELARCDGQIVVLLPAPIKTACK